jgi:hypothetical protein
MDQVAKFVGIPLCWYGLSQLKVEDLRRGSFDAGYAISQKCKGLFWWDTVVEPILIAQLLRIFIIGHSFVQGLVSDNVDQQSIQTSLEATEQAIAEECAFTAE